MADHRQSRSHEFCGMHHFANVCKACKSFLFIRRHSDKNKIEDEKELKTIDDKTFKVLKDKNQHGKKAMSVEVPKSMEIHDNDTPSPRGFFVSLPSRFSSHSQPGSPSNNDTKLKNPSLLSKSASRRSQTPTRTASSLLKTMSRKSVEGVSSPLPSLSRSRSTTIMYSNKNGVIKPPAVEQTLECSLEEICFGCIKKIKITRDVVTNEGQIVQEDEVLTIKVKPGWRSGTKITFEGMGNEIPGGQAADMTFVIAEKQHPLFSKDGDDLLLGVTIPLVKALAGCTLSIPLLNGEKMRLAMEDEIIYSGYEKFVQGQGLPKSKEQGERGNLIVKFVVDFPTELTDEQRAHVFNILKDCC